MLRLTISKVDCVGQESASMRSYAPNNESWSSALGALRPGLRRPISATSVSKVNSGVVAGGGATSFGRASITDSALAVAVSVVRTPNTSACCFWISRHGHQDVVAFLDGLQTLTRELPFHRQRDQQLFPHQPQTRFLHGAGVVEKLDVDVRPLPDSPRPPTGLPQRVDRIARLVEVNLRERPEI